MSLPYRRFRWNQKVVSIGMAIPPTWEWLDTSITVEDNCNEGGDRLQILVVDGIEFGVADDAGILGKIRGALLHDALVEHNSKTRATIVRRLLPMSEYDCCSYTFITFQVIFDSCFNLPKYRKDRRKVTSNVLINNVSS